MSTANCQLSLLPSFLPSILPSFHPSILPSFFPSRRKICPVCLFSYSSVFYFIPILLHFIFILFYFLTPFRFFLLFPFHFFFIFFFLKKKEQQIGPIIYLEETGTPIMHACFIPSFLHSFIHFISLLCFYPNSIESEQKQKQQQ